MKRFAWVSAVATALTFPLIALGAIVRLEGAGLACPDWPLCYGRITPVSEVVAPAPDGVKIALEVGHRYWAGILGLVVIGLAIAAWTKFRDAPSIRWLSAAAVGLLIPQAVLGGLTVLMDLAPITVSLHLIAGNLFFGSLLLLTVQAFRAASETSDPVAPEGETSPGPLLRTAVLGTLVVAGLQIWLGGWVSSSGASLACSSFPTCHGTWALPASGLEQLQMGHRLGGFILAGAIVWLAVLALRSEALPRRMRAIGAVLVAMVVGQILLGWFNVAHYVPVPTSAMHTALAAAIFGTLTYLFGRIWIPRPSAVEANAMSTNDTESQDREGGDPEGADGSLARAWRTIADYRELTKPRIVHLLVLTAFCTMLVAASGLPDPWLVAWTLLGTTLVCGSAQVVNMIWDRDIDAVMERTSERPIVQGRVSPAAASVFSAVLGVSGTAILFWAANPLAAAMGIAGHLYYTVVYTMWLKRRTPQNIVIGGGAGAFPTLIGWTAVTGSLGVTAWLIFAVVFFWTPPHFWALALYKDTDYEAAGVPMMPVVRGERTTKFQMLLYTSVLIGVTALLGLVGTMGIVYFASAILLGAGFAFVCIKTAFAEGDAWPKRAFAYSIIYLALLFGAMSVDSISTIHFTDTRQVASAESSSSGDDVPNRRVSRRATPPPPGDESDTNR